MEYTKNWWGKTPAARKQWTNNFQFWQDNGVKRESQQSSERFGKENLSQNSISINKIQLVLFFFFFGFFTVIWFNSGTKKKKETFQPQANTFVVCVCVCVCSINTHNHSVSLANWCLNSLLSSHHCPYQDHPHKVHLRWRRGRKKKKESKGHVRQSGALFKH